MKRPGLVVRRALGHRLLAVAASATALFAVTVLAALAGYAASVTGEGLRTTLAGTTFGGAGTQISTAVAARDIPAADRQVSAAIAKVYGRVPAAISLSARGDSYIVPGQERSAHPQLTTFATYSGIEGHARLTAGRWPAPAPAPAGGTVEAALPEPAARAMRLAPGRTVVLNSRVDGPAVTVRVTGLFAAVRADDYFWGGDRLVTTGVERLGYTTFGPLVVPPATFTTRFTTSVTARWLVLPSLRELHAGRLKDVERRARALPATLGPGPAGSAGYTVKSSAADLLSQVDRALLVSRSTLMIPALQLILLAVYTLVLVARLLAEHRRVEITLMRARGASAKQVAALSVGEGLLLSAPAAVAAPFLAPFLVRAVTATPLLGTPGLRLHLTPSALIWAVAITAALACAAAITLPPLRGVRRTYVATVTARGRGERRGMIQRAGADLALVVVAGLAVWQLAHYGGPVTTTAANGLGVDPLIVAGPALALLAGGVVILRLVPVASRAGERATTRARGLAAAVGTRQVSRRPLRTAGPALLLVMTVAVGVLSLVTGVTWRQSQVDQADFQAGADLRIGAPGDQSSPMTAGQGGRYARLPGVIATSPVLRDTGSTGSAEVTVLAADAATVGGMLRNRPGISPSTPFARLAGGGPTASVPVPGHPTRLSAGFRVAATRQKDPVALSLIVSDALHVTYEVDAGTVPSDGRTHTKEIGLTGLAGRDGLLSYPLAVRGLRFTSVRTWAVPADGLAVTAIRPGDGGGLGPALRTPPGTHWSGLVTLTAGSPSGLTIRPGRPGRPGGLVTARLPVAPGMTVQTPQVAGSLVLRAGPTARDVAESAPMLAIVTGDLAARAHLAVGGQINLTENGVEQPITIAGIVPALPSTTPGVPAVLLDWTALQERALASGGTPSPPTEWWLATRAADTAPAARALAAHRTWGGTTVDRIELRHRLRDAPLGGALQGALLLGFAAALVFAATGFVVNTAVSARERATEFAILRALGVSGRQLLGLVAVEQAFLVGLGVAGGLLLGLVVARLVVPHVVLTVSATAPYPPVHVILRWPMILALLAAVVVLLTAVLLLLVRSLRRGRPGRALRLGEDR
ncbi:FtsX-like permease family protein [Actinomadura sp. DC4]|uniref:FtsX-like permease family protein n=1 Tax=Actinomadura sp. DC4 TaxID=3055069 RepID=UPI0025B08821|nr:FtsX-like permease family protein [Actinomadura sp. DC4]MDN3352075.1 FtsX-like permease family protein [Actinomadura sp. DC4]